jgi:CHAT domain-containing protein
MGRHSSECASKCSQILIQLSRRSQQYFQRLGWFLLAFVTAIALSTGTAFSQSFPLATDQVDRIAAIEHNAIELEAQGRQLFQTGQFSAAAAAWQEAATQFSRQGDTIAQAGCLSYQSMALYELGHLEDAQTAIAQSLNLLQPDELQPDEPSAVLAQALHNQGRIQLALGQTEAASETWYIAAQVYAAIADLEGQLGATIDRSLALQTLGLYRQSQQLLDEVMPQLATFPDSRLKVLALGNLGTALRNIGQFQRSHATLEKSLVLSQSLNLPLDTSAILVSLGNTARADGHVETALAFYQQAAQIAADSPAATIIPQLDRLDLLVELQRWDEARPCLQPLQAAISQLPPSRERVYTAVNWANNALQIVRVMVQSGTEDRASIPTTQDIALVLVAAIRTAEAIEDERAQSYAYAELGNVYWENQQLDEARQSLERALLLASRRQASDMVWQWQVQLGKISQQQGKMEVAIAAYTEAIDELTRLRGSLFTSFPDRQFSFQNSVEPVYRQLVSLLLQSPHPTSKHLNQARETIEALQLAELDDFLRETCLTSQPVQIDRIDPTAAVIYPIVSSDESGEFVRLDVILSLPKQPLRNYHTQIPQAEFAETLGLFRQALSLSFPESQRLENFQKVYDWSIRPMEADLEANRIQTLVFVLNDTLRNLPMAALYDGKQYLIEKYAVALTPGLQLLEPRPIDPSRLNVFLGGLSESREGFTALPEVRSEVSQIEREISSQVRLDRDFTTAALRTALLGANRPVLHLATHAQFSSNADDTYIVTWDGKIKVSELGVLLGSRDERRSRAIELLVLSACQTAKGDSRATLGMAGLAVKSGARSAIATLWSIRDRSTADLMAKFYKHLISPGTSKAEALRQAQLSLLHGSDFSHPYFWAPFVLVGNWL